MKVDRAYCRSSGNTGTMHLLNQFDDVDDFLSSLLPHKLWETNIAGPFIFRGVSDYEQHKLKPTALRDRAIFGLSGLSFSKEEEPGNTHSKHIGLIGQVASEVSVLQSLYKRLQQQGIRIPGDSPEFRERFIEEYYWNGRWSESANWPAAELFDLIALAQHSGLPTRFLDWTRSPFVAAYFAASGYVRGLAATLKNSRQVTSTASILANKTSTQLAVWVTGEDVPILARDFERKAQVYTRVINPTSDANPFMSAQQGLFLTVCRPWTTDVIEEEYRSIEDVRSVWFSREGKPSHNGYAAFCLPCHLACDLLLRLNDLSVNTATLFPGTSGAAQSVIFDKDVQLVRSFMKSTVGHDA